MHLLFPESELPMLSAVTVQASSDDGATAHDPDGPVIGQFLNAWIRSERGFRGRQVWRLHTAEDGTGIDRVRYLILRELVHGGPRRLSELADNLAMTTSHASRVVDSLVRRGLAERSIPEGDRRVTLVSVTGTGRDLLGGIDDTSRRLIADRLAVFTDEEAAQLSDLFDRFATEVMRWSTTVQAEVGDGKERARMRARK